MSERHLSVVEQEARAEVAKLAPNSVQAVATVLRAHTQPREFAAAVCVNVAPMLEEVDDALAQLDTQRAELLDRRVKLERLAAAAEGVAVGVEDAASFRVVAGRQIAHAAVMEARALGRTELDYHEWFRLFREAGWVIESVGPEAAFLTALTRCADVERVGRGVYRIRGDA